MSDSINNAYRYKLQLIDEDKIITHEFNADIDIYRMGENLRDFLTGCSWRDEVVERIMNTDG